MPRKPNPNPPGRGNRSENRGRPLRRRIMLNESIARQVRERVPEEDIGVFVNLIVQRWLDEHPNEQKEGRSYDES